MGKLLLLTSLAIALLISTSQAASLLPQQLNANAVSASAFKDPFIAGLPLDDNDNAILDEVDDNNIVDEIEDFIDDILDDSEADLADDDAVEELLTDEEKAVGEHVEIPVSDMDDAETNMYLDLEEQIFWAQADEHIAFQLLKENKSLYTKKGGLIRKKRVIPLIARAAFTVARGLASRFARTGATRSGSRITNHYNGRGSFRDATRDFNRMRPSNVRSFDNGRISGQTGTMGPHRVTVRNGSSGSNSRPTLEIRSHGGDFVRKFRYNN